jgi:glycosyltransferase involved in cell wall biosynthesis
MTAAKTVSVVLPVKDGALYLEEVINAISSQKIDASVETVVVDSGSRDGSVEIARSLGARVIEIPESEFGHGRTRNFAAEQAAGDRIAFLTQDATPASEDWLASLVAPLDPEKMIGLSFGPHLPRPGTSPMIARELREFFGMFSSDGAVRVDSGIDPSDPASVFFSNVNSCLLRDCWRQVRFRDVAYAEDQAFARDAMLAGWKKSYVPAAAVLHAHDYPFLQFMRRYFDEYRGLRETVGHVAQASPVGIALAARAEVRDDLRYMRREGYPSGQRVAWALRSSRHHAGRAVFAALGSRAQKLPGSVTARLSLEESSRSGNRRPRGARRRTAVANSLVDVQRYLDGERASLSPPSPHDESRHSLHLAWVIPPFRRGSGGHMTIFNIVRELELMGHSCSVWVHDPGNFIGRPSAVIHNEVVEHFSDLRAGVYLGFDDWQGADVAFATGWQTAYPLARLPGCKLKTYLVQDYEPDFYAASVERMWAEETYRIDFPCITASPWLSDLLRERYGATAVEFDLGVDHHTYRPLEIPRESSTIVFYARQATPRRATALGLMALAEVAARRSGVRFVLFGDTKPLATPFEHELAGVVDEPGLARLYNRATMGLVLSLTNYSRIPKEMMACGLPVVELRHPSVEAVFGRDGRLIEAAEMTPQAIAERLVTLLDSPERRSRLAAAASEFVAPMTWARAASQIEAHARRWLGERWSSALADEGQSRSASVDFVR